jgi:membrane-bound inhibitor of C-type lysozyme
MRPFRIALLTTLLIAAAGPGWAASPAPPALTPAATDSPPAVTVTPTPSPIPAASSAVIVTLGTTGDFERKTLQYGCQGQDAPMSVDYINAAPNYLALVPIEGSTLIFNTVLSASGARYAAGKYVWWTKGPDASLYDLTQGANAKPILTCTELNETP